MCSQLSTRDATRIKYVNLKFAKKKRTKFMKSGEL